MTTYAIQEDFGGFSPRFMGITVRFDARYPTAWQLFQQLCVKDREPRRVIEMGNDALKGSPSDAFEMFSVGTVFVHEIRHFHDFILSPFGNHIFRLRVTAAVNGTQAVVPVLNQKGILPVPISIWTRLNPHQQRKLISYYRSLINDRFADVLKIPKYRQILVKQTESSFKKIRDLLINPQATSLKIPLQPYQLFEASGILTQIQNVYSVFGAKHADLFTNILLHSPSYRTYGRVFHLLADLWHSAGMPSDLAGMSKVIIWSILGDYSVDLWEACPTVRFNRLFEFLTKEGPPSQSEDTQLLFDKWTTKLGVSPISEGLRTQTKANKRFSKRLKDQLTNYNDVLSYLVKTTETFYRINDYMSDLLIKNPEIYANPYLYQEEEILKNWVAAPVRVVFTGGGLLGAKNEFGSLDIRKAISLEEGRFAVLTAGWGQTMGIKMVSLTESLNACDTLLLSDYCFDELRHEPDFEIVRQFLEKRGIIPLEVIY